MKNERIIEAIKEICVDLFGIEDIGYNDDFFELGVNSLLATQLLYRIKQEFKTDLSLERLLSTPNIKDIVDFLESEEKSKESTTTQEIEINPHDINKEELEGYINTLPENEVNALLSKLKEENSSK